MVIIAYKRCCFACIVGLCALVRSSLCSSHGAGIRAAQTTFFDWNLSRFNRGSLSLLALRIVPFNLVENYCFTQFVNHKRSSNKKHSEPCVCVEVVTILADRWVEVSRAVVPHCLYKKTITKVRYTNTDRSCRIRWEIYSIYSPKSLFFYPLSLFWWSQPNHSLQSGGPILVFSICRLLKIAPLAKRVSLMAQICCWPTKTMFRL